MDDDNLQLTNKGVHVFYADLYTALQTQVEVDSWLNVSELSRYYSFKKTQRQQQFLLARMIIQVALKRVYGTQISTQYQLQDHQWWQYCKYEQAFAVSISHSQQRVAVAITLAAKPMGKPFGLGLDIEYLKDRQYPELGEWFLTLPEQGWLREQAEQKLGFYQLWTAKEALFKASNMSFAQVCQIDFVKQQNHVNFFTLLVGDTKYQCLHKRIQDYQFAVLLAPQRELTLNEFKLTQLVESDFRLM